MISTIHRRHILGLFEKEKQLSWESLKKYCIDSGIMNQTTLYRLLAKFESEGLIHRIEYEKEKIYILCSCEKGEKVSGVRVHYCTHCHQVEESHFPISGEVLQSQSIEYLRYCDHCSTVSQ